MLQAVQWISASSKANFEEWLLQYFSPKYQNNLPNITFGHLSIDLKGNLLDLSNFHVTGEILKASRKMCEGEERKTISKNGQLLSVIVPIYFMIAYK